MSAARILIVRLGSMGDVIHTLPAAFRLKRCFPNSRLSWLIRPRWAPLLEENACIEEVIPLERSVRAAWKRTGILRRERLDLAIDFQGLIQSAVIAKRAGALQLVGFGPKSVRERPAAFFYSRTFEPTAAHVVDRNLELAAFAAEEPGGAANATNAAREFPLPTGVPEGTLPEGRFVLASPFAGWGSKEWPFEFWGKLAALLPVPLVLNGPPQSVQRLAEVPGAFVHVCGVSGLIDATRRATAVIGVDSGPLHLAAALRKPGVALFGPTDPARNGPYGGSLRVLRAAGAVTDYHRRTEPDPSMRALTPSLAARALNAVLEGCPA